MLHAGLAPVLGNLCGSCTCTESTSPERIKLAKEQGNHESKENDDRQSKIGAIRYGDINEYDIDDTIKMPAIVVPSIERRGAERAEVDWRK